MKILAMEKDVPGITDEITRPHLKAEAAQAWALYQAGVFRELYFRGDRHQAVLILECKDEEEARQVLETLPLVQQGLVDFDIIPLAPYPGFARLFVAEAAQLVDPGY